MFFVTAPQNYKKITYKQKNAKEIFKILINVNKLGAYFYKMTKYLHVLTHDVSVFCSWKHCVSQSDAMLAKNWCIRCLNAVVFVQRWVLPAAVGACFSRRGKVPSKDSLQKPCQTVQDFSSGRKSMKIFDRQKLSK